MFQHKYKVNNKVMRKKPRVLIPSSYILSNPSIASSSTSSSTTTTSCISSSELVTTAGINYDNHDDDIINKKLDLLINIINSQQKLLENLIIKTNKSSKKMIDQSIQTDIPYYHIIQSGQESKERSPLNDNQRYPPIPQSPKSTLYFSD